MHHPSIKLNQSNKNKLEWTKCGYKTQQPLRLPSLKLAPELKQQYDCLHDFKYKPCERVYARTLQEQASDRMQLQAGDPSSRKPCYRLSFSSCGKLSRSNAQIKLIIERFGGEFSSSSSELNPLTVAVVSNTAEVEKMSKKMSLCLEQNVHVVDEAFLDDLAEQGFLIS